MSFHRIINVSQKNILVSIAIGVWCLVIVNIIDILGIRVDATVDVDDVKSSVGIYGIVDVDDVKSTVQVDANIESINGHSNVFFNNPSRGDKDRYYVIPVTIE